MEELHKLKGGKIMTLQQLLHKTRGEYELTIFRDRESSEGEETLCADEEIPEEVTFEEYISNWDTIKKSKVKDFRLTLNRNCNGPAIWVTIE